MEFDSETDIVKNKVVYDIDSNKYKILDVETKYEKNDKNAIKDILKNIGQISM